MLGIKQLFPFVLAILANVAYCACYVVDVAGQISAFHETWVESFSA
jgi:hypothetical protein